jgi:hypothetical protein
MQFSKVKFDNRHAVKSFSVQFLDWHQFVGFNLNTQLKELNRPDWNFFHVEVGHAL